MNECRANLCFYGFFFPVRGMRREEWWKGAAVGESEPRRRSKAVQTCTMSQGCYCPVHFFFSSCYLLFGLNFISCSGAGVCVHVRTSRELREGKRALSMSARLTYSVPTFFFFSFALSAFLTRFCWTIGAASGSFETKKTRRRTMRALEVDPKSFFFIAGQSCFFLFILLTCHLLTW